MDGEAGKGQSEKTECAFLCSRDKGSVGISAAKNSESVAGIALTTFKGRQACLARLFNGPDSEKMIDPVKTTSLVKPVGPKSSTIDLSGDNGNSAAAPLRG